MRTLHGPGTSTPYRSVASSIAASARSACVGHACIPPPLPSRWRAAGWWGAARPWGARRRWGGVGEGKGLGAAGSRQSGGVCGQWLYRSMACLGPVAVIPVNGTVNGPRSGRPRRRPSRSRRASDSRTAPGDRSARSSPGGDRHRRPRRECPARTPCGRGLRPHPGQHGLSYGQGTACRGRTPTVHRIVDRLYRHGDRGGVRLGVAMSRYVARRRPVLSTRW